MGIKAGFTRADIAAEMKRRLSSLDAVYLNVLHYLGERCVTHARSSHAYRDQTGNLTNSIGYVIVRDGVIVSSNFQQTATVVVASATGLGRSRTTTGSISGTRAGEELAKQLARDFPRGYTLIVVAGMNYATAVESRGLDVLSSAEKLAETELPRMLADLKVDIRR